ncbi:GntR family transcriptional regulator [Clostridium amazonitimonense]|uniref:GntR family transcriptional regulator n=1 Tax=Clostridium amazonitimonense TaxID=1499689 RepID=UPI00068D1A58|nr:GntR family transcriptional regulator [Clostridium amazonitimonense]
MQKNSPLYIQIMEIIKEKILTGEYKIGDFIPTEIELEEEFKVSKITIRKAIELLETEGYVMKKSGRGTTVLSNSIFNKLSKAESFSSILKMEGYSLRKEIKEVTTVFNEEDSELYQYFGEKCYKIIRIYYLDDVPYIYFEHYIPYKFKLDKDTIDNDASLYMLLHNNQLYISKFQDEFFIDYPKEDILTRLQLGSEPLLGRKRKSLDSNNNVLELSYAKYNTKVHNYIIKYEI